jgi:hypothetical protein
MSFSVSCRSRARLSTPPPLPQRHGRAWSDPTNCSHTSRRFPIVPHRHHHSRPCRTPWPPVFLHPEPPCLQLGISPPRPPCTALEAPLPWPRWPSASSIYRATAGHAASHRGRAVTSHLGPCRGHLRVRPNTATLPRCFRGAGKASITGAGSSGVSAAASPVSPSAGGRSGRSPLSVSRCEYDVRARLNQGSHVSVMNG